MTSLSFPDINLWMALAVPEHAHFQLAIRWWEETQGRTAFCRLTQLGLLRLLTTSAAMNGKPLSGSDAWAIYDRFFQDDRVIFLKEPVPIERLFREKSCHFTASPKVWADAWLLAFAEASGGRLITFDRALAARGAHCLLPERR